MRSMIFPARHFRLKVAGAGSIMEGEDAPTTKRTEASVFKRRSEISHLSSARPGSTEYWSDIRALVRHLEPKLAELDPVGAPSRLTEMFELYVAGGLITGGDLDSLSLDAVSSVIRRHSSSVVFLRLTLAEPGDLEETVDAVGDYLDLLQRWLQSRAVTLSFMAERGEVVRKMGRDVVEPIDFDDLNREAYLLTNLAIGMDEQVPDDLGFPGVFTWLHEVGGSTADLYDNWRTRGLA